VSTTKTKRKAAKPEADACGVTPEWRAILGLLPGYDPFRDAEGCWFDQADAEFRIAFVEECCQHYEGSFAGQPFLLEPWEKAIYGNLFGWKRRNEDGETIRRYRTLLLYIPRGNGKTPLSASLCVTVLGTDNEPAAQIYGAAGETEQAALLFRHAKGMVEAEPELLSRFNIYTGYGQRSIQYPAQNSYYRVVSGDPKGRHGYNPHMVLIDELHICSRDMVTALTSAFVKRGRKQPLCVYITTADFERESVCNDIYSYGCKVRDGAIRDPHFLPAIWDLDRKKADEIVETPDGPAAYWTTEECWRSVNPNLGVSVSVEGLRIKCREAQASPSAEGEFKRLNLNCRTEAISRWLPMERWRACSSVEDPKAWRAAMIEELKGARPWAALDLGSTSDITALSLLFRRDKGWLTLPYFWVPGGSIEDRDPEYRALYRQWIKDGFLTPTYGVYTHVQDYDQVKDDVLKLNDWFMFHDDPEEHTPALAIDRKFQGDQLMTQLGAGGLWVVTFNQTMMDYAAPAKKFEEVIMAGILEHGNNPVLTWMAGNAIALEDNMGNKKPVKPKGNSPLKVDGIQTSVMALARAMADPDNGDDWLVGDRNLIVLG
jgi:phage terminase large subunit-like protein